MRNSAAFPFRTHPTLNDLLSLPPHELAGQDIAVLNLACAVGLPGSEKLDIPQCLQTVAQWTFAVQKYTDECLADRTSLPPAFRSHPGAARFAAMVTLLKHPSGLAVGNFKFTDSRDHLLYGLLTRRLGTHNSLPALFTAIGRRLGYPIYLAIANGHVLCQWVDERGKINLEGSTGGGAEIYPDEHYYRWPQPMTPDDIASNRFLRPLTPQEEFALFLEIRGHILAAKSRFAEARDVYLQAHRISRGWSLLDSHLRAIEILEQQFRPHVGIFASEPITPSDANSNNVALPNVFGNPAIVASVFT